MSLNFYGTYMFYHRSLLFDRDLKHDLTILGHVSSHCPLIHFVSQLTLFQSSMERHIYFWPCKPHLINSFNHWCNQLYPDPFEAVFFFFTNSDKIHSVLWSVLDYGYFSCVFFCSLLVKVWFTSGEMSCHLYGDKSSPGQWFSISWGRCNDSEHKLPYFVFTIVHIVKKINMAEFAVGFVVSTSVIEIFFLDKLHIFISYRQ